MPSVSSIDIENQGFPPARQDITNTLQAIATFNESDTPPPTPLPYQPWFDRVNRILKMWDEINSVWVDIFRLANFGGIIPVGGIQVYAGDETSAPPSGWLYCDGNHYDITDPLYAGLYSVIGDVYQGATAPPAGRFRVPSLQGRTAVGLIPSTPGYIRGTAAGQEIVALTVGQMPFHNHNVIQTAHGHTLNQAPHAHAINDLGHNHGFTATRIAVTEHRGSARAGAVVDLTATEGRATATAMTGIGIFGSNAVLNLETANANISIGNTGATEPHNNMPPYLALTYIIRI